MLFSLKCERLYRLYRRVAYRLLQNNYAQTRCVMQISTLTKGGGNNLVYLSLIIISLRILYMQKYPQEIQSICISQYLSKYRANQ